MPPERSLSRSPGTERARGRGCSLDRGPLNVGVYGSPRSSSGSSAGSNTAANTRSNVGSCTWEETKTARAVQYRSLRRCGAISASERGEAGRALGRDRDPGGAQPLAQRGRQARDVDPVQLEHGAY